MTMYADLLHNKFILNTECRMLWYQVVVTKVVLKGDGSKKSAPPKPSRIDDRPAQPVKEQPIGARTGVGTMLDSSVSSFLSRK